MGAKRHARYSYVGYDPDAVVTVGPGETTVEALASDTPLDLIDTDVDGDAVDALRGAMPDVRLVNFPDHDRQHLEGGLVGSPTTPSTTSGSRRSAWNGLNLGFRTHSSS